MKKPVQKSRGVVKGASSGFIISLGIHAGAILLAGMIMVFTVVKKEEKKFVPPKPIDRPKMKLRKPKVKVKKSAKPKPTTRIVTKVKRASMPDIQLPEMSGMTDGLVGGIGGFEMAPDIEEISIFGSGQSVGNDFVGTFYDFKRNRSGSKIPMDPENFIDELTRFVSSGWKASKLARFYRSPKKLYTTTFAVPPVQSIVAPAAFGEDDTLGYCWAAHYKGDLVHHEDIKFRFWGFGDDILIVKVDGKIVLNACWPDDRRGTQEIAGGWDSTSADSRKYPIGNNLAEVGDWIELKAREPKDMEVLIGEVPGGVFQSMLVVQVEGVEYERNPFRGGPRLPIFKTEEPSVDLVEKIWADLDPGDAVVTNGPVFRDYPSSMDWSAMYADKIGTNGTGSVTEEVADTGMRVWTDVNGKSFEAEFVMVVGDKVVLKSKKGKQQKVPLAKISEADLEYIDFATPPEFNIDFSKKSSQRPVPPMSPFTFGDVRPLRIFDYTFGVKMKQKNTKVYSHELTVEYFAIGDEVDGDNYVLLDRRCSTFTPSKENKRSHEFYGDEVKVQTQQVRHIAPVRGTKYGGYLITISDERGEIIQYKTSNEWLYEIVDKLKTLPVSKHFNKEGNRVPPPRPGPDDRPTWV